MPRFHRYAKKSGGYVRAKHGRAMVTYQVTPAGEAELKRRGVRDKKDFSPEVLRQLVVQGLAYTNGSGPGKVDSSPVVARRGQSSTRTSTVPASQPHSRPSSGSPPRSTPYQPPASPSLTRGVCGDCGRSIGQVWCGWCGKWATLVQFEESPTPSSQVVAEEPETVAFDIEPDRDMRDYPDYRPSPPPIRQMPPSENKRPFMGARRLLSAFNYPLLGMGIWLWGFVLAALVFLVYVMFFTSQTAR